MNNMVLGPKDQQVLPFLLAGSLYSDFAKAFDSVNNSILIKRGKNMGVNNKLLEWSKSYS